MPARAFTTILVWLALVPAGAVVAAAPGSAPPDTPPPSTFNVFYPEERPLGDCLNNSLPVPNCGSEARGGWHQYAVFGAMIGGLVFIGWRIVHTTRRPRRTPADA